MMAETSMGPLRDVVLRDAVEAYKSVIRMAIAQEERRDKIETDSRFNEHVDRATENLVDIIYALR